MAQLFGFLGTLVSIYMLIIFVRIIMTWFSWMGNSRFTEILAKITDPYLNWFRRFDALRLGYLDLSPIVALGVLSLVNRIFYTLALYGTISLGIILAMILQAVWGAVSFFLGFLIVILILRFIGLLVRRSSASQFWRIIDTISQPVLYRINRILFKDRIMNYRTAVILSIVILGGIYVLLRVVVFIVAGILARSPI